MRANMRVPWAKKQQKKEAERRRTTESVVRRLVEEQYSSVSTIAFSTAGFFPSSFSTYMRGVDIDNIPVDRGRAETKRESRKRTLEPILVDPPPLRPVRQFE